MMIYGYQECSIGEGVKSTQKCKNIVPRQRHEYPTRFSQPPGWQGLFDSRLIVLTAMDASDHSNSNVNDEQFKEAIISHGCTLLCTYLNYITRSYDSEQALEHVTLPGKPHVRSPDAWSNSTTNHNFYLDLNISTRLCRDVESNFVSFGLVEWTILVYYFSISSIRFTQWCLATRSALDVADSVASIACVHILFLGRNVNTGPKSFDY